MNRLCWLLPVAFLIGSVPVRAEVPTFNKDVAPILWKNCTGCHRSGEVGPFPLMTYKDAAKRADFLVDVTESRQMPPWKAEPGFGQFHDERRLTDAEIKIIADWAENGAVEGDSKDLPKPPTFPDGWQLGTPDLVLKAPASFDIPADGKDIYRCFVIPIPSETTRKVAAVEFRPGNRKVVHHALFFLDSSGAAREKDSADPGPGFESFGGPGFLPTGALGGWAPGAMPRKLPEGMGRQLAKGSDLVLQIHYHPDGKPETDQSSVGIYYADETARQIVGGIILRDRGFKILPGEKRHHISVTSQPLPVAASAIGITPHMHYIGKEMKVVAETPDGQTIPMIWIKDWDFNWQGQYQYRSPIKLPKGTIIKLDAYYDNSSDNPRNPSQPPRLVKHGEQTTDEMCLLGIQVVTDRNLDLLQLLKMNGGGIGRAFGGAGAAMDEAKPKGTGVPIPEARKALLGRFDKNNDGRLSSEEIEAMPERLRERVKSFIRDRMGDQP